MKMKRDIFKPHTDTFFDMLGIEPEYIEDEDFGAEETNETPLPKDKQSQ